MFSIGQPRQKVITAFPPNTPTVEAFRRIHQAVHAAVGDKGPGKALSASLRRSVEYRALQARFESVFRWPALLTTAAPTDIQVGVLVTAAAAVAPGPKQPKKGKALARFKAAANVVKGISRMEAAVFDGFVDKLVNEAAAADTQLAPAPAAPAPAGDRKRKARSRFKAAANAVKGISNMKSGAYLGFVNRLIEGHVPADDDESPAKHR